MKVLVVLWYWPPSGGPGVQRGLLLCRHLRACGVEPVAVVPPAEVYAGPGEYVQDPSLADVVPPGQRVVRTPPPRGRSLRAALARLRLVRFAAAWAPGPHFERQAGWLRPLAATLVEAVERERPDAVLTSSQPYVVHLAGRAARLATGVPWVADFRDPWTQSWGRSWPSRRALAWEERREEEVLFDADAVVANTPGAREQLLERRPWLDPRKVAVVPNGYDPDDFGAPAPRDEGVFRVVHVGAFRARPPGTEPTGVRAWLDRRAPEPIPYDLSTHSPETLFRAVAARGGRAADRAVRVRLVGTVADGWLRRAEALGVRAQVEARGPLPHRAAVSELLGADLLHLPTITRRDGGRVANVPAKTYEYLGSGRPVVATAGPGDVADLLAPRARCRVVGPTDVEALADLLRRAAAGEGPAGCGPDPEDARPFRRQETARAMAELLGRVVGKSPAPSGAVPTL